MGRRLHHLLTLPHRRELQEDCFEAVQVCRLFTSQNLQQGAPAHANPNDKPEEISIRRTNGH